MPALMLANESLGYPGDEGSPATARAMADMPDMGMRPGIAGNRATAQAISPTAEFPYGFPSAGRYRVFVQMKHGGTVETAVFDAEVR
jgi:hypothetical protein